jgi:hypothetical protein
MTLERWTGYDEQSWAERFATLDAKFQQVCEQLLNVVVARTSPNTIAPGAELGSGEVARLFHETYERLAPDFGYETRQDTRQFDPESANGRLMIAVCASLIGTDRERVRGEAFLPMEAWDCRDETVLLLVDYTDGEHPLDDATFAITIGHNNDHNVGEGEGQGWQFAGWCWCQDCYTEGEGKPIGWMPLPHHLASLATPGGTDG